MKNSATNVRFTDIVTTNGMQNTKRSVSMTTDRSIEEPCEATSLKHGFEAERRGRPLRLGSALLERLKGTGLPVECGSGGLTKYNRSIRSLPKTHWLDASCVGASTPLVLKISQVRPLLIGATGHGRRQMCLMDARGFPRTHPKAKHFPHEFRTGDIVKAVVPAHLKNSGVHVGRMSARAKGAFTIDTSKGTVTDIGKKYCRILQRADGYGYAQGSKPAGAFLSSLSRDQHEGPQKGF